MIIMILIIITIIILITIMIKLRYTGLTSTLFSIARKNKKTHSKKFFKFFPKEVFLIFRWMELSSPKLKKFLTFFWKKNLYLIFFIRIFIIRMFFITIIRRDFYVVSNKLRNRFFFFFSTITFLLKTLEDNSFCLFYKLNLSILLIDKYTESPLLVFYYCKNLSWCYSLRFHFSF